jgi:sulfatase maturation enzyme AslB (radical SAM superfamily)
MDIQTVLIALLSLLVLALIYQKINTKGTYDAIINKLKEESQSFQVFMTTKNEEIDSLTELNESLLRRAKKAETELEELEEDLNDLSYYDVLEVTDNEHFDKIKEHFRRKFYATTIIVGQGEPITMDKKSSKTKKE